MNSHPYQATGPVTNLPKKPLTPDQIDAFRPAPAIAGFTTKEDLYKILGPGAGIPRAAASQLANIIWALTERVALLEFADKIKFAPHLRATEKRS